MQDYSAKFAVKSDAETPLPDRGEKLTGAQVEDLKRQFKNEWDRVGEGANGAGICVVWYNAVLALLAQYDYVVMKKEQPTKEEFERVSKKALDKVFGC